MTDESTLPAVIHQHPNAHATGFSRWRFAFPAAQRHFAGIAARRYAMIRSSTGFGVSFTTSPTIGP